MRYRSRMLSLTTLQACWSDPLVAVNILVFLNLTGALPSAIGMVWISKLEGWLPSRQAVAISLKFDKNLIPTERTLHDMANSRGYDIASGTISIALKDGAHEWNFVAVARSRQKMGPPSELARDMTQFRGMDSFQLAYARN